MSKELMEALEAVEKEHNISKEVLLEAIQNSLVQAYRNNFGKSDNVHVAIDPDTADFSVRAEMTVVEEVEDPVTQMTVDEARLIDPKAQLGDTVMKPIDSKKFGRIATQNAKNVVLQKIREEERKALYKDWYCKEKDVVTGVVQRYANHNYYIDLGKIDAVLPEAEQVKTETFKPTERIKLYVTEVRDTSRGPHISVSRTHPELVKRLFEQVVPEVKQGLVEIVAIAREAGSRTKMAVRRAQIADDPKINENIDPVGSCVGPNGERVNAVVRELRGEKIDIINWDDNAAFLIENALSPAKVILVLADEDAREAQVIVPDFQLSLAIGKEGQNARLAAKLTGYRIDIKSETEARESGLLDELEQGYQDGFEGYTDDPLYEESGETPDDGAPAESSPDGTEPADGQN